MLKLDINQVINITSGQLMSGPAHTKITGISTDSRQLRPGQLFVAIIGENHDGHDFIYQAAKSGAIACLVSSCPEDMGRILPEVSVIKVDDTVKALGKIASFHRSALGIQVIAVTGSTGKTTTKDMIWEILRQRFNVARTYANYNNEIGLPLTLLSLKEEHDIAVLEMGMRGMGQIAELCDIAMPDVGVVTNVNETHMELLGSIELIADAKSELISSLPVNGLAVINRDNKYTWNMKKKSKCTVNSFGVSKEADVRGEEIVNRGSEGINFNVITPGFSGEVSLGLPGKHNAMNALAAICVCIRYEVNLEDIRQALKSFKPSDKRMNIFQIQGITIIDDTYNASPISMCAALETMEGLAGKSRKVAVLGDMFELGDCEEEGHETVGNKCIDVGIDTIITVGNRVCHLAKAALKRGFPPKKLYCFQNSFDSAEAIIDIVKSGDYVLVKGSRGMKMEKVVCALREGLQSD